ncbi:hypothetical protein OC861_002887 [Tilletia horrida]|nr:hypothetical protein OC861_002887 [Tilletia horrida]
MSSARPRTPTSSSLRGAEAGSYASSSATRPPLSPNLLDSLLTTADVEPESAQNLADLSLTDLVTAPGNAASSSKSNRSRPSLDKMPGKRGGSARPSWGPNRGGARPRMSLFTRKSLAPPRFGLAADQDNLPALSEDTTTPITGASSKLVDLSSSLVEEEDEEEPTTSHTPLRPPARPTVLGEHSTAAVDPNAAASSSIYPDDPTSLSEHPTLDAAALRASAMRDREEALKRNLIEARRMNEVFEAYEAMLLGSAEQIDQFAQQVRNTDTLLDSYIALLRDSSRTQELLLSPEWKGASADSAEAHELAVALAQRETERVRALEEQRRREAEIERRRREAEMAERERAKEEEARRAALVASSGAGGSRGYRASTTGTARGGLGSSSGAGGVRRGGTARGASTASTRGSSARPPVAGHTRGSTTATRGAAASSSTSGSRIGRPSSIPRPPSGGTGY